MTRTKAELRERYARHKKTVGTNQRRMVAAGQDIAPIPPIANPERRQAAAKSLRVFCETYFRDAFYLDWSPDQLRYIAELEKIANKGGRITIAMPRGSGKSTLSRCAMLWAILTGRRHYGVLIAATGPKARSELAKIKTACETNADLVADFPEALYPVKKLDRITQRQKGQTYLGKHTRLSWLSDKLVFPVIPGSKASGAIICAAGLQGGDIRGQSHELSNGKIQRPDFAIADDPQTRKSAVSDLQCERREQLLNSDVMGMPGPKTKLSIVCTVTVIRRGDLADRLLDRKKNPQWNGIRMKMLNSLPTRLDLWAEYTELRRNAGDDGASATAFYKAHRAEMDADAEAAWAALFNDDELSAIQHALNLKIDDPETFASEYQNEPEDPQDNEDTPTLKGLTERVNRLGRGILPQWATHLVAMIDVQEKALYYKILAAADDFTAVIADYGNEPEQATPYFALRDVQRTLTKALAAAGKDGGIEAAIYYGLECLTDRLFTRTFKREDGAELTIQKALVDSGDQTKTVYEFCRRSKWRALLLPSKGAGITAGKAPIDRWKIDKFEKRGDGYVITTDAAHRAIPLARFDTNHWKTFVCRRAAVAGGKGSLTIWGDDPRAHRMIQDHVNAESCVKTIAADGRTVWEWSLKPGAPDNHHFDTLIGGYVALAITGCKLDENRPKPAPKKPAIPDSMIAGRAL